MLVPRHEISYALGAATDTEPNALASKARSRLSAVLFALKQYPYSPSGSNEFPPYDPLHKVGFQLQLTYESLCRRWSENFRESVTKI